MDITPLDAINEEAEIPDLNIDKTLKQKGKGVKTPFDDRAKHLEIDHHDHVVIIKFTVMKLILAILAFTTALAWSHAFKGFFEKMVGEKDSVKVMFVYAICATVVAVAVSVKWNGKFD